MPAHCCSIRLVSVVLAIASVTKDLPSDDLMFTAIHSGDLPWELSGIFYGLSVALLSSTDSKRDDAFTDSLHRGGLSV